MLRGSVLQHMLAAEDWGDGKDVPWRDVSPDERFDNDVIKNETREVR